MAAKGNTPPPAQYGPDGNFVGPMTPEQLAQLDRALTPAEQRDVENWQEAKANADLAAERAKGGPTSAAVSIPAVKLVAPGKFVAESPAVIKAIPGKPGTPWWVWVLLAAGAGATGGGLYLLTRKKKR